MSFKATVFAASFFCALPLAAEERFLIPIHVSVPGAFGSAFTSDLRLYNAGNTPVEVRGVATQCRVLCPPPRLGSLTIRPGETVTDPAHFGRPGSVVKSTDASNLRIGLRVRDFTRNHLSAGTEIPVIRESQLTANRLFLLGVPPSAGRFRNRLRVYAFTPGSVRVLFIREADNAVLHEATLQLALPQNVATEDAEFYPAFAESVDFPSTGSFIRVQIEPLANLRVWGFVTTTNNETQEITVVTPQP